MARGDGFEDGFDSVLDWFINFLKVFTPLRIISNYRWGQLVALTLIGLLVLCLVGIVFCVVMGVTDG